MNAGACPNAKCAEFIDFESMTTFPTKCKTCDEVITEKHCQHFKDMMYATRMHLDKMKMSSVACKFNIISKCHRLFLYLKPIYISTDLDICGILVGKQRGILHRMNVLHLKTLDLAFESAIDVEKWDDALEYGTELIPGFWSV